MSQVATKDTENWEPVSQTLRTIFIIVFLFGVYSAGYSRGSSESTRIQKGNNEIRQNELIAERARSNDEQRNLERVHKTQIEQIKNDLERSKVEYSAWLKIEVEERKKLQNILDEMNRKTHAEKDDFKSKFLDEVRTCASAKSELIGQLAKLQSLLDSLQFKYDDLQKEHEVLNDYKWAIVILKGLRDYIGPCLTWFIPKQ